MTDRLQSVPFLGRGHYVLNLNQAQLPGVCVCAGMKQAPCFSCFRKKKNTFHMQKPGERVLVAYGAV